MGNKYDLTVIGGGPGGYVAAIRAAQLGLKVAVIEDKQMGGTCLNRGCIPTKSLLHSSEVYQTAKTGLDFGIVVGDVQFDFGKIIAKKDSVVKRLRSGIEFLVKKNGATIINGLGYIKDKNTIEVTGKEPQTITTDKIIIATGSRPSRPPIPGLDSEKVLDSDSLLDLKNCPDKLVIIGGGVIGIEFATVFNSLGKDVTIIEMMDEILPGVDSEISSTIRKSLLKKGIILYTSSTVLSIETKKETECVFKTNNVEQRETCDLVLVAIGRKPNSEGIGLENIGLVPEKGFINVNDKLETSVPGVYAIGDVTGKVMLAHVASAQGLIAAANVAGIAQRMDYSVVPGCIYTSPEIATVGMTEAEAIKQGNKVKVGRFPVSANGKSMIMGETEGLIKIVTDETTGEILGTHILAPRATDMIAEMCLAMKLESTVEEISNTIHPHPTVSEIIMEAAHDVEGLCVHKPRN